ncbi:MAG: M1 family aminopeptidase [Ferruginibacter sp.]
MRKFFTISVVLLLLSNIVFSQPTLENSDAYTQMQKREMAVYAQRFGSAAAVAANTVGLDYDVKYHRLQFRLNPDSTKYIRGSVTTYFTTLQNNFNLFRADMASPLVCDSVYYHGVKLAAGNIVDNIDTLEISIPNIASQGTLDSLTIYYQGVPKVMTEFGGGTGFVKTTHNAGANNYIYTLSESYSAFTWWPCKNRIANDKADSVDIYISTPTGFRAAANGTRISETTAGGSVITYWKNRYPLSAYQVCVAVANYTQYPVTPTLVNISGTNMPYYNLIFPETNTANAQTALNRTPLMITTMSSKFGDYPFKNEKYGHYTFGFSGGMEHNTFSGMNANTYDATTDWSVIAHELGHQWWGASVTCGSWHDIWVNESFARYSEIVALEFAPSISATTYTTHRGNIKSSAMNTGNQNQTTYVADTTNMTTIFSPSVYIYDRGAMIISMMRTLLGDTKFFQATQNYQSDPLLKYGNAYTADVKRHMEAASGLNLTTFFNNWMYNKGYATYSGSRWNNTGNKVFINLLQVANASAPLTHFDMPLVLRIQGAIAGQDTTVVVYDEGGIMNYVNNGSLLSTYTTMVQYDLSFTPTTVTFDPFAQTMAWYVSAASNIVTKDAGLTLLSTNVLNFSAVKEGAGAKLWWSAENITEYLAMEVERSTDGISFEKIAQKNASAYTNITAFNHYDPVLPPGRINYRIKVNMRNGSVKYSNIATVNNTTDNSALFNVWPNPATDFIYVSGSLGARDILVRVLDVQGKTLRQRSVKNIPQNSQVKLPVSGLSSGLYSVEIRYNGNSKETIKIAVGL